MTDYVDQIAAAASALTILAPLRIAWFGRPGQEPDSALTALLDPANQRELTVALVGEQLYRRFYLTGGARPGDAPPAPPASGDAAFLAALARANAASACQDAGWLMQQQDSQGARITKGGLALHVPPDGVLAPAIHETTPGQTIVIAMPCVLPAYRPGAVVLRGERPLSGNEPLVRVYWHLLPAGASSLAADLSVALERAGIPWDLKLLNHPAAYTRCDAGVLYLRRADLAGALPSLERAWIALERAGQLRQAVPALTRQLAAGIAIADDPGDGVSFGSHRCRLLADGLLRDDAGEPRSPDSRLEAIAETFAEAGIALDAPYLAPGAEEYDLPGWRLAPRAVLASAPRRDDPLMAATTLGERLARDAIRHADRATWLAPRDADPLAVRWQTLGPDLYDGLAGAALFLSELHLATGIPAARDTALAALHQALHLTRTSTTPPGFFDGRAGVAWVAARVGRQLDAPDLSDAAARIAATLHAPASDGRCDLLGGLAGIVAGLVLLCRELNDASLLAPALAAGDRLLARAIPLGDGLAWPAGEGELPLTGFGHGASGIASALLALYAASGEPRFRDAALAAFRWERGWRDEARGSWPDFRDVLPHLARGDGGATLPDALAWCHGAPGIALARLAVTDDPSVFEDATLALAATRAATRAALDDRDPDGCLCHGLAGLREVLGAAAPVVAGDDAGLLAETSDALAARAATTEHPRPALFTGDAGIGLVLLRAAGTPVPCVLAPWH